MAVSRHDVQVAVAVEVANCQAARCGADVIKYGTCERAAAAVEQDCHAIAAREQVGNGQVGFAVLVEIGRDDKSRSKTGAEGSLRGGEASGTIAIQDAHVAVGDDRHILVAVAAEVAGRDRQGRGRHSNRACCRENAFAVIEQDADGAISLVGHDQIGKAIVIEIHRDDAGGIVADCIGSCDAEAAAPNIEQDCDRPGSIVIDENEIRLVVAVEVGANDLHRVVVDGVAGEGLEGTVAGVQQDADAVAAGVRDRHVRPAVAVKVGNRHTLRRGAIGHEDGPRQREQAEQGSVFEYLKRRPATLTPAGQKGTEEAQRRPGHSSFSKVVVCCGRDFLQERVECTE